MGRRLTLLGLIVALSLSACSSTKKAAGGEPGELAAAHTCVTFVNVLADQENGRLTPPQVRVKFFTLLADLTADAQADPKLKALGDAAASMSEAIRVSDTNTALHYAKATVDECTPLLKKHNLLKP